MSEKEIIRGDRTYNGPASELMNEIYDQLQDRGAIEPVIGDWAQFSLSLARACSVISRRYKRTK